MNRRTSLILYLVLNVIVSAATTLAVLTLWERMRPTELPVLTAQAAAEQAAAEQAGGNIAATAPPAPAETTPQPTETLPPVDQPLIEIVSVVGPGDLEHEVVLLKRLGEGNLRMAGWRLESDSGTRYVFPEQPDLVLYKDGAVQVYSKVGADTATDVYWNRSEPAWKSGESVRVVDAQGNERAVHRVP
jgi:hypothetical protein